ncbi:MAG: hypothetical protein LBE12_09655 [Planctomycetaceae bacterium]|jgi:hypothetical protein|nr:hypothetical protein [Planctomycetaceae bacterium]
MRLLFLLFSLFLLSGCTQTPPELADISPVTITVTNNGLPVEGVLVSLFEKTPSSAFGCNAQTDKAGVAKIKSTVLTYIGNGAPPGTYTVVLSDLIIFPPEIASSITETSLSPKEQAKRQAKRDEFIEKNRRIPKILESFSTSSIELTVTKNEPAILTIDLSKY